jgi:hypothetical protein
MSFFFFAESVGSTFPLGFGPAVRALNDKSPSPCKSPGGNLERPTPQQKRTLRI